MDLKIKAKLIKQKLKNLNSLKTSNIFCCCSLFSSLLDKINQCVSKISIFNQFIIYFLPVFILFTFSLIIIHLYLFDEILKFDFYTIIKEEFLKYFISDFDDISSNLNKKRTSLLFEDISNLAFFKIYFDELNSYGFLNNDNEKIFPNISGFNESIYKSLDQYNTIFSIPKDISEILIDSRNDSLSELAKIYYYFYPLIATESNKAGTFINQTFLISYEVDDNNDMKGEKLYFNYPRITDEFIQNNNFFPYNNLIAPIVLNNSFCKNEMKNENPPEEKMKGFIQDNWFFDYDCQFRNQNFMDFTLNFFHLNENNRGSINKTNIIIMQSNLINNKNKKYIINIIFFLGQKKLKSGPFDDSVFLITNFTVDNKKFSDDQTYVLNNNDITEIALSTQLNQYFHYGLSSINNNFFSEGVFYDNIDINELYEPTEKYSTIDGFNFDMRYFSSFYLFTKLFEKSFYTKEYMDTDHIYYYIFNSSEQINNICSKFDFKIYIGSLKTNGINCFNDKNLLYYSRENIKTLFSEGLTLPYCICLPLYCIKNLENDYDLDNIEIVDEIILPEKCQNNLLYYLNDNENENEVITTKDTKDINFRIYESLNEQLESQFISFSNEKMKLIGGINFVKISIIDNDSMKNILVEFVENLNKISTGVMSIIIIGIILVLILISILLLLYINSISNIIFEYKNKAYSFLKKLTNSKEKNELNNKKDGNTILDNKNNYGTFPLLYDELKNENNIEENELIEDLYKIYYKFYNIQENNNQEILENKQRNKTLVKINILNKNNELFKLFIKLSLHMQKLKLNINIDYDFYKDSKLINNLMKTITKKSNTIDDKEQLLYTNSILKELLSTELINDYGFVTNLNFNYITNINLNTKNKKKNYIQSAIFKKIDELIKQQKFEDTHKNNKYDGFFIENIKIVFKNKNLIMKKIEEKFEQDDYLNLSKLESFFNSSLLNSFYDYIKKIINE